MVVLDDSRSTEQVGLGFDRNLMSEYRTADASHLAFMS